MKRFFMYLVLGSLATVPTFASVRSDIEKVNSQIAGALLKRDIKLFEKLTRPHCTKDFKHIENGQAQNYDQMLANMKMGMGMMQKTTKAATKTVTFKQSGNKVVMTISHEMVGVMAPGEDKKTHTMGFNGVSQNSYRKENGKWMLYEMKWLKQTMLMDGKPFDPSAMGGG